MYDIVLIEACALFRIHEFINGTGMNGIRQHTIGAIAGIVVVVIIVVWNG